MVHVVAADDVSEPAVSLAYDYERLEPDLRARAMHSACRIKFAAATTVAMVIEIGEQLDAVHADLTASGEWTRWLTDEFRWKVTQADKFLGIYRLAKENPQHTGDLTAIGVETAELLARRSTPPGIRREVLALVAKGQRVTRKMVIEMLHVPNEAPLPSGPKKKKPEPPPESLDKILIGLVNAFEQAKAFDPADVAKETPPALKGRYRKEALAIADWLDAFAEAIEPRDQDEQAA